MLYREIRQVSANYEPKRTGIGSRCACYVVKSYEYGQQARQARSHIPQTNFLSFRAWSRPHCNASTRSSSCEPIVQSAIPAISREDELPNRTYTRHAYHSDVEPPLVPALNVRRRRRSEPQEREILRDLGTDLDAREQYRVPIVDSKRHGLSVGGSGAEWWCYHRC